MVPIRSALEKLATDLGKTYSDYNKLCEDIDIVQAVVKTLGMHGIKSNLEKFEIPKMMTLAPEVRQMRIGCSVQDLDGERIRK
jgi:hypothetical protein